MMATPRDRGFRAPLTGLYGWLVAANLAAWAWAFLLFRDQPLLLGTALLAYGFGLRHAVDADHIAAIDNVTRKLMQDGKRPLSVGLFFALGHSTVVALAVARGRAAADGAASAARAVQAGRRRGRHAGLGAVPVRDRGRQPRHPAVGLADLPPRETRRALRRGGSRPAARQPRPAGPPVPPAVRPDHQELAHVSAGLPVRAGLRHRDRGRRCSASRRRRPRRACRSGRSWCFRPCSPPAWRWSTRPTAC